MCLRTAGGGIFILAGFRQDRSRHYEASSLHMHACPHSPSCCSEFWTLLLLTKHICGSTLSLNPSASKRAVRGELTSSDFAISTHKVLATCRPMVIVSSTPLNIAIAHQEEVGIKDTPLVLTTSMLDLDQLVSWSFWAIEPVLAYMFDHESDSACCWQSSGLLHDLVSCGEGGWIRQPAANACVELLLASQHRTLVQQRQHAAGHADWQLTLCVTSILQSLHMACACMNSWWRWIDFNSCQSLCTSMLGCSGR